MEIAAAIARDIAALPKRDTASLRSVRRAWSKALKTTPADELLAAAETLEAKAGQGGKWIAYELIRFHPAALAAVTPAQIDDFADRAQSWYAVDALGTILTGFLWARGRLPDKLFDGWSRSDDLWRRRSALVATVGLNARASGGPGDAARTLAVCRRLASDREDMVVKGLSWALRALAQRDRPAVEAFLAETGDLLPARVKREVGHKLATGLKTPRKRVKVTVD